MYNMYSKCCLFFKELTGNPGEITLELRACAKAADDLGAQPKKKQTKKKTFHNPEVVECQVNCEETMANKWLPIITEYHFLIEFQSRMTK